MFPNNYFAGANFVFGNGNLDSGNYPFEMTNGEASNIGAAQTRESDLDALDNLSTAEIENWWLAPKSNGDAGQYAGSTLLDSSWSEFTGGCGSQPGPIPGTNGYGMGDAYCLGQQYADVPGHAGLSAAGLSTASYPAQPAQLPPSPPVALGGPGTTPSPVPTLSWGYSPSSIDMYTAIGNDWPGMYDQQLTEPNLHGQWPYPTSVGMGRARTTDNLPRIHPPTTGDTMRRCQQPYAPENYEVGPNPQTGAGVATTDLSTQVAPSTGPRRPVRRVVKGKRKETEKDEGERKRIPKKDLAPGIDWPKTHDRFRAELAKIYNQPTGEVINPETAYTNMNKFVKEDLYLSPLAVKPLGERPSRDLEQYLIGILNELRPRIDGQKMGVRYMLERVTEELENGLVVVNDDFALMDGPSNEIDPEELSASKVAVKRRIAEQARRGAIRRCLERITLFLRLPEPGYLWSRPQVLFFAITYLVFGARVFGDGGELFTPKPQL